MSSAEYLAGLMATSVNHLATQISQTRFRLKIVETWQIPEGAKLLEVGCGQGDMTAVLADAVGPSGKVVAVDIAEPTYGAPINLGDSSKILKNGPLGSRIDFHFAFDLLDAKNAFDADEFDFAVLSHCSWYFSSPQQLLAVFSKLRASAKSLCFSEWDMQPARLDQTAHLLAILIQGQIEIHKEESLANIRSPLARSELRELMQSAGWQVQKDETLTSEGMEDAKWEILHCLRRSAPEMEKLQLPERESRFLKSQIAVLESLSKSATYQALPSYSIVAAR